MGITVSRLTVFFEPPFWIDLFERECDGVLEACKITFGAEPKDYEIYGFMLKNQCKLSLSPSVAAKTHDAERTNPKRMQRQINRQLQNVGIGTKAQQAEGKRKREKLSREQREAEKQQQFELRREKQKEKHRGH